MPEICTVMLFKRICHKIKRQRRAKYCCLCSSVRFHSGTQLCKNQGQEFARDQSNQSESGKHLCRRCLGSRTQCLEDWKRCFPLVTWKGHFSYGTPQTRSLRPASHYLLTGLLIASISFCFAGFSFVIEDEWWKKRRQKCTLSQP